MEREYAWSQIEPAVAILCACFVTYKPLFTNFKNALLSTLSSDNRTSTSAPQDHWTDMENTKRSVVRWPVARDFGAQAIALNENPPRRPRNRPDGRSHRIVIDFEGPDDTFTEVVARYEEIVKTRRHEQARA